MSLCKPAARLRKIIGCIAMSALLFCSFAKNQPALQVPPGEVPIGKTPMFIGLGFDDNSHSGLSKATQTTGGIKWVSDFTRDLVNPAGTGQAATFDGSPVRCSFFSNSIYMTGAQGDYGSMVKWATNHAYRQGHEIGNHTHSHIANFGGPTMSADAWAADIQLCTDWLTKPAPADADTTWLGTKDEEGAGIPAEEIVGLRSPYLLYGEGTFTAAQTTGMKYDCSIEEGLQDDQDGTNFYWPYTLENESPGHNAMVEIGTKAANLFTPTHPGLWELPCYAVILPPDSLCSKYGIPSGMRQRMKDHYSTLGKPNVFDVAQGKLTGLDYNWYYFQEATLSKDEALAMLKYSLDQRMKGNRAPMLLGVHSQYYTELWNSNATNCNSAALRQAIIEEFVAYALETYPEVRIVPYRDVMDWCENPVPLGDNVGTVPASAAGSARAAIRFAGGLLQIALPAAGRYDVAVHDLAGRILFSVAAKSFSAGVSSLALPSRKIAGQECVVSLRGEGINQSTRIFLK